MLKGFMVPRSALGQASLDPPPPWHYSGDVIAVEFWADPAVTASLLPQGLSADPKTNGQAFVLIDAQLGSRQVTHCPFIYVDNDAAIARGWAQGFPKKLGSIFQTRTYAAPSLAAAPVQAGGKFAAALSAHGQRLAEARVTLREAVADPFTVFNRPTALVRYFPRLVKGQYDEPAVNELTVSITDNLKLVDMWRGEGQLSFPQASGEELHTLGPVEVGAGFRYGLSYSVSDLEVVKDFTK
jgi:acetoacetate decarboxylase